MLCLFLFELKQMIEKSEKTKIPQQALQTLQLCHEKQITNSVQLRFDGQIAVFEMSSYLFQT